MRTAVALLAVAAALGTASAASAGTARPVSPSLQDCVSAWNVSPGVAGGGAARRVHVDALGTATGEFGWDNTHSWSFAGPGCAVWVLRSPGHVLVVYKAWKRHRATSWRKPVTTSELPSGDAVNAVLSSAGVLKLL